MLINFFKPVDSFSLFAKKSNPTITECTKAEAHLKNKIDKVENILKEHAYKRNIIECNTYGEIKLRNKPDIINSPNDWNLVAKKLMGITSHNTTAKDREFTKEISKLSKSLDKYIIQTETLEKNKQTAKLHKLHEIVEAENKLANLNLDSGLPALVENQKLANTLELDKISVTAIEPKIEPEPSQLRAINNIIMLSEKINSKPEWLQEEGILRVPGNNKKIESITKVMNEGGVKEIEDILMENDSHHDIFGLIKNQFSLALTDLERSRICNLSINYKNTKDDNNYPLPSIIKLPLSLQKLMPLLINIDKNKETNKMGAQNIAMVLAPRIATLEPGKGDQMKEIAVQTKIIENFLAAIINNQSRIQSRALPEVPSHSKKDLTPLATSHLQASGNLGTFV
ncbi:RhoGAP domain [Yersinia aldovae]|uniref:Rho GTPase-activating protein n=1 Tax=Yersinia aldovae TaxID=29483 RepID=UPI0005E88AAA|nr:Rho GTPase-activating protein [Yersinia aldovae]CNH96534.1 RhoGAP domain [Yersinia aldovae]